MNKILKYALLFIAVLLTQSCIKDLQDDINDGGWNHERSVINITFENQIGSATIENLDPTTGEIGLNINVGAQPSLTSVKVIGMELSYQATASIKTGDSVDLSTGIATITVTSDLGETRIYTIKANSFREDLEGTWAINKLSIFGGTGLSYGGGAVFQPSDKSWCWDTTTANNMENDNTITFKLTGVSETGNPMGTCINDAGPDGEYAQFIFKGASNPEGGTDIDCKYLYRQIPEGESTWERDYVAGTITFTDKDGKQTIGSFLNAGMIDLGYGYSFTVDNNAFQFVLHGVDDWNNVYGDYDKFVKNPRNFWVSVTKIN